MKRILIFFLVALVFNAFTCGREEGDDCHHALIVRNESADTVIVARVYYTYDLCSLSGVKIGPTDSRTFSSSPECWEDEINYYRNDRLDIYIVDPILYNDPMVFYSMDSIEIKNKVLKHFCLSIDDMRKANFVVTYP